ncbi:MAG: ferredoxin--NADP reductase [Cyclobacteriaceae bacterium]
MKLTVSRITKSTDDSVSVWFAKVPLEYKPGQHAVLALTVHGQKYIRTYSFHTSPYINEETGITVRAVEGGVISNYLLGTSPEELEIDLQGISGDFVLAPSVGVKRHLVMFGAGSGITPLYSMIRSVLSNEPSTDVTLLYSNKSRSRIIFNSELQSLRSAYGDRLNIYHTITQEEIEQHDSTVFYNGRVSKLIIRKFLKEILPEITGELEYYLCGPLAFMELIEDALRSLNVEPERIRKEYFFIPRQNPDVDFVGLPDREIVLLVNEEEKVVTVRSGQSILQATLAGGIAIPYSCTEGQCGKCQATLLTGEVRLKKNHALTDDELERGQILLCQGFPVTDNISIRTGI